MDFYNREIMSKKNYLANVSSQFWAPLVDRTGLLNKQIAIINKIPTDYKNAKTFKGCSDNMAISILKRADKEDRDIRIAYSGGVDSTTALVALLKNRKGFKAKIIVVMNQESIKEYPWFYDKYIKDKLPIMKIGKDNIEDVITKKTGKKFLIVDGELGDQLFGSQLYFMDRHFDLEDDWTKEFKPAFVKYFKPVIDKIPYGDTSTLNVLWWLNFVFKYQFVDLRPFIMFKGKVKYRNIVHFFSGEEFQKWAMKTRMKHKWPDVNKPGTYKIIAKQYIKSYTNDNEYFRNKEKKGSLKFHIQKSIVDRWRVTDNFEYIPLPESEKWRKDIRKNNGKPRNKWKK